MNTETQTSFNWLRKIPGELFALDQKPLLGYPPVFPWDKFSAELNKSLQTSGINVMPGEVQWRAAGDLFLGLGDKLKVLSLSVTPLSGPIWWVMPEKGVKQLMNLLVNTTPTENKDNFIDEDFLNAFYQFFAAEAINAFEKIDFDKKLSVLVNRNSDTPSAACLTIDSAIKFKDTTVYGRLLLSQDFQKAWAQKYAQQQKLALESPIADSLDVIVHLEAGKIDLKPSEWKQLAVGDFVLLDACSIDPDEDKGRVMLVVNGTPCFRAKIKQGSLKILEHPLYHEVDKSMPTPPSKEESAASDEDDLFGEDESSEIEHNDEKKAPQAKPADHDEDDEDDDFDIEEDHDDKDDIEKSADINPAKKSPPAAPKKSATPAPSPTPSNTPLNVDEIPLPVVIEVGRIQMSVKKLLELQPGNMLELDIHPESGVDMVVNGKRIARGELLRIGDAFGLRITELS